MGDIGTSGGLCWEESIPVSRSTPAGKRLEEKSQQMEGKGGRNQKGGRKNDTPTPNQVKGRENS